MNRKAVATVILAMCVALNVVGEPRNREPRDRNFIRKIVRAIGAIFGGQSTNDDMSFPKP